MDKKGDIFKEKNKKCKEITNLTRNTSDSNKTVKKMTKINPIPGKKPQNIAKSPNQKTRKSISW